MAEPNTNPTPPSKPTIFVVDDNEAFLIALTIVLKKKYNMQTIADSTQSVEAILTHKPRVIILDVLMPIHDGFWVYQQIRKYSSKVPIIFNSAYQNIVLPEDISTGIRPFAFLTKEGNLEDIENAIQGALASGNGW